MVLPIRSSRDPKRGKNREKIGREDERRMKSEDERRIKRVD